MNVLFVCMGNICRSPMAEGLFTHHVEQQGLTEQFDIDSAGTHAYHEQSPPDVRAIGVMETNKLAIKHLRARRVVDEDFEQFDQIIVMDHDNLNNLKQRCPQPQQHKLKLFMAFATDYPDDEVVPDPYYGGKKGFERIYSMMEQASLGLLRHLKT